MNKLSLKYIIENLEKSLSLHVDQIEDLLLDVNNRNKKITFSHEENDKYGMKCSFISREYPGYKFEVDIDLDPKTFNKKGYISIGSAEFKYKTPIHDWIKLNIKKLKFPKLLAADWEENLSRGEN